MQTRAKTTIRAAAAIACLGVAAVSLADISDDVFVVTAASAEGSGTLVIPKSALNYDPDSDTWYWDQLTPIYIMDGSTTIATLKSATLTLTADPQISLGFSVKAGGSDTTFQITSARLSFPTIPAAVCAGQASAGASASDLNNDGVLLQELQPGAGIVMALYNYVPPAQEFVSLLSKVQAGPGGSGTGSQDYPAYGYLPIPADVYNLSVYIAFTLTAGDLGGGIANYEIVLQAAKGDLDCDGLVNTLDIDPFVLAVIDPSGYESSYPNCSIMNGDINQDGVVNPLDVDPFVQCVIDGECP